jgi:hypothetical protein
MRHFWVFCPITALAIGMGVTTSPARLVAATGVKHGGAPCMISAD